MLLLCVRAGGRDRRHLHSFPTRRSSDLARAPSPRSSLPAQRAEPLAPRQPPVPPSEATAPSPTISRSEEHTSELQSRQYLVCRLLLEKKKTRRARAAAPACRVTGRPRRR